MAEQPTLSPARIAYLRRRRRRRAAVAAARGLLLGTAAAGMYQGILWLERGLKKHFGVIV